MTQEPVKIVVFGPGGVGKSAITIQFTQGVFITKYDPTIEDSYRKVVDLGGRQQMVEILDTAGTEQFHAMRDLYIKGGHCFALIYSVVARSTFNDIPDIYEQILRVKDNESCPIVLVGNKCDMYAQRVVTTEEGADLAKKLGIPFLEASAKTTMNVDEIFLSLVKAYTPGALKKVPTGKATTQAKKNKSCTLF